MMVVMVTLHVLRSLVQLMLRRLILIIITFSNPSIRILRLLIRTLIQLIGIVALVITTAIADILTIAVI